MKKIRILLTSVLALALLTSVIFLSEAEQAGAAVWQADLQKLMDPADVPKTTEIRYQNTNEAALNHDIACEVTVNGVAYGCEFTIATADAAIEDWTSVQAWLGDIVTDAARTSGSDSEALAKAIDREINSRRRSAQAQVGVEQPLWAREDVSFIMIRVSTPFYPELKAGKNGEDTKRLQQKLIELGYLTDAADGYYGQNTENAVRELQEYIRELERDLIDARLAETPTPSPAPTATATPTAEPTATPTPEPASTHELILIPKGEAVTVEPAQQATMEPTQQATIAPMQEAMAIAADMPVLEPVTEVDGIADALLQAYLYSERFVSARRELADGDSGGDVTRMQRRLAALGCSVSAADGFYGDDTVRSVRIFQHYNGLNETGEADMATLERLYSSAAVEPEHPLLTLGSTGDEVRALQLRLTELGFANISADGSYGAGTQTAVQTLQAYMRAREEAEAMSAVGLAAEAQPDVSSQLRTEVNGVADPMLLDELYSDAFPAVPASMQAGSKGEDVLRLQRRLRGLEYIFTNPDGSYGAQTSEAVTAFQKRHKLEQTGVADRQTLQLLFSGDAKKALKPYVVKVSTDDQRVYVYGLDDNNEYTVLVRTMKCSTGKNATPTPKGTYQATTGPGARWHYFKKYKCWAQYAYYIEGDIMFHSVLYNDPDGPVTQTSVNNLGRKASHGCVRLSVEDAKWLYYNCPMYTKVVVY